MTGEQPVGDAHRPRTRGDCAGGPRPCLALTCKFHLLWDQSDRALFRDPEGDALVEALLCLPETCALDIADRGGASLEDVGAAIGVTRERARQLETQLTKKLQLRPGSLVDFLPPEPTTAARSAE